jgi:hypothetical protein
MIFCNCDICGLQMDEEVLSKCFKTKQHPSKIKTIKCPNCGNTNTIEYFNEENFFEKSRGSLKGCDITCYDMKEVGFMKVTKLDINTDL